MPRNGHLRKSGFSLLELVIVVTIIGIVASIAIPRMSRGAVGASDSALAGNLEVMRKALDTFAAEHGGQFPTLAQIPGQFTGYTDHSATSTPVARPDATHGFGPYLQAIPSLPAGANKGKNTFTNKDPVGSDAAGWYYNEATGEIKANCADSEADSAGIRYNSY